MKIPLTLVVCSAIFVSGAYCVSPDVLTVPPDLQLPKVTTGNPLPGKRVLQALSQYEDSDVRHALYLPTDWQRGKTYPVLVEYTGNNGTVKGGKACQGYGISGGKGFLWICLPYVSKDGKHDMDWWWGDPDLTADYAKAAVTDVCEKWGGDATAVILTGYSRGAIACNYIGLRNDDIARTWLAMVPASHYDNRRWGMSPAEFQRGPQRLKRLRDTPQYVCGEHHLATKHTDPKLLKMVRDRKFDTFETAKRELNVLPMTQQEGIREFINKNHPAANITFADFPWVNHTGDWILRDTRQRRKLRDWVQNLLAETSSGRRQVFRRSPQDETLDEFRYPKSKFTAHPESRFADKTPEEIDAFERDVAAKLKTLYQREICDLALVPPILNTNPLPKYDYDQLDYGMTIGIARTSKGRIWSCWVAGEDGPGGFFVLNRSDPDGEKFSKPLLVINMHKKGLPPRSTLVGNLWTDPSGKLWLFFNQTIGHNDGRDGVWATTCENPDAATPQWSKPRRICNGFLINKPTILANGEWMLPIEFIDSKVFPELKQYRGANILVSTDKGESWNWRSVASFPDSDWVEPMIVELKDGRLWMLARTFSFVMQRFSSDGGRTWTEPSLPNFKHPEARFFIRRLASGRILLVKHGKTIDSCRGRSHLTAWLSKDDGKTWQGGLMLDERATISYPDGFQSPDGTLHISYDRNRSTDGEILMARFTEEDVLAKKPVSSSAKLRMLISRPQKGR